MDDKIKSAVLGNATIKIVLAPDVDAGMRKLADEAIKALIGQPVAVVARYDPALEPMRALARAADRLGVLIECDNEDRGGASPDDVATHDGLLRVLARWQSTYGDASQVNPKRVADDVALALNEAIVGTDREWVAIGINDESGFAEVVALAHPTNAARIVAAKNATSNVPTSALEAGTLNKLLEHAAITHDTLSELAENGELPSAIQSRVADHLEEGTALFRAAGIESEPAPITAESLRM